MSGLWVTVIFREDSRSLGKTVSYFVAQVVKFHLHWLHFPLLLCYSLTLTMFLLLTGIYQLR